MKLVQTHGAAIPALGFGTYLLEGDAAYEAVRHALDLGYRHLDTAQIYQNEREVGRALADSGVPREEVFLTTKVWIDRFSSTLFAPSVEASLRRLGTDYVDLLLLHWPNPEIPLPETMRELNRVHDRTLARHIGVSNFTTSLLADAQRFTQNPLVTNQVEYHPYLDQSPVLDALRAAGMSLTAYSPLARAKVLQDETMREIAEHHGKSPVQVALRWLLQQEDVIAIPKASSRAHAAANFAVFDFALTDAEMASIHGLAHPEGRLVNPSNLAPAWDRTAVEA